MKILLLTPFYAIDKSLGLDEDTRAIHYFTKKWVGFGHDVTVIHNHVIPLKKPKNKVYAIKKKYKFNKAIISNIDGVKVRLYINNKFKLGSPKLSGKQKDNVWKDILGILESEKDRPDIIIIHFPTYYLNLLNELSRQFNIKIIGVFHNFDIKNIEKKDTRKLIIKNINAVGFRSRMIKKRFYQNVNPEIEHEFQVHSGVPDDVINNIDYNLLDNFGHNTVEILYVGKLNPQKNVDLIIRALKKLDSKYNFKFTIIGNGQEKTRLNKLVERSKFKNKIEFKSAISREKVLEKMKQSDIFVMPSTNETLGLVYLEAMANGCITIGTIGEGIDGIIKNNYNGILVKPNDLDSLKKSLERIMNLNEEKIRELQLNALNTMKKYSETNVASMYLKEIHKILNNKY